MPIHGSQVLQKRYIVCDASREELWFQFAAERIKEAIARDQWLEAQQIAIEWAGGVCEDFGLRKTGVWKFFKRSLAARWFGRVENRRFQSGWSVEEALQYANSFSGRSLRLSLFPENITCHATSFRLLANQKEQWESIIAQADNSVAMEMFPESSTDDTICFRRDTTQYGEEVVYEAGKGQAMYVFEQEQGQHPIVAAIKAGGRFVYSKSNPGNRYWDELEEIETKLRALIEMHDDDLAEKSFRICRALGIDYLTIEGYFGPAKGDGLVIVDLDLPFDFVFMAAKAR